MTTLDRIKELCKTQKNISITTLEQELGYSNGSLAKAKIIPSTRILEISHFLGVSMEYLMTGKEPNFNPYSEDMAHLVAKTRNDTELSKALLKYFELSDVKKNHVVELINLLSEN